MPEIAVTDLSRVSDLPTLFGFLNSQLGWKVDPDYCDLYDLRVGPDSARVRAGQIPPFSGADPFVFVVAEFEDRFRRTALRETLRDIRRRMRQEGILHGRSTEDVIFLCPCDGYEEVRFAHFEERDGRQPSLSAFGWERRSAQATRTVRELNLDTLRYQPGYGSDVDTWRARWLQAWDVEAVTRGFFETYKRVFEEVEPMMVGVQGDRRLFAQRLFNRLLFIRFLEKKGWLQFDPTHPQDRDPGYLARLFNAATRGNENFYRDRLFWLFFRGLGNIAGLDDGGRDLGFLRERRGDVPYLNGGLFEQEDADDFEGHVEIPNEAFERIINGLFYRYNFTVTESAPDDVEVAVDPEMLGKVFEELVTGRHETGSYYTPRPIVAFMCREALKGYLGGQEALVDRHDAGAISVPEARELLGRLADIRVVDPACGSGAYLLGMLYELFTLTKLLDTRAEQATARDDYNRKLDIIQNNLYGVDLDPFAVNVARLRLWLSLVVEYQGDDPPPLPNLDFKIEVGDSLLAPAPKPVTAADMFREERVQKFVDMKRRYMRPGAAEGFDKSGLRREIEGLRREIAAGVVAGAHIQGFDWRVDFAEVFEGALGGFDVVLANPPYISTKHGFGTGAARSLLRSTYTTARGQFDAYSLFLERAIQLLAPGGHYAYIVPKPVLTNSSMKPIRRLLAEYAVLAIGDPGLAFSAHVEPIVLVGCKTYSAAQRVQIVRNLGSYDAQHTQALRREDLVTDAGTWRSARPALPSLRQHTKYRALGELLSVVRGVEVGKRDSSISTTPQRGAFPVLRGEDVGRYNVCFSGFYIRPTDDLHKFKPRDLYRKPGVLVRRVANDLMAAINTEDYYVLNTVYVAKPLSHCCVDVEFLCAVLNSRILNAYFHGMYINDDAIFPYIRKEQLVGLPIAVPSQQDHTRIAALARKCLDAKGEGCAEWEAEIDDRVAALYGV